MTRLTVVSKMDIAKERCVFPTAFEDLKSGNIAAIFEVEGVWYARVLNGNPPTGVYFGLVLGDTNRGEPVIMAAQGSIASQTIASVIWVVK